MYNLNTVHITRLSCFKFSIFIEAIPAGTRDSQFHGELSPSRGASRNYAQMTITVHLGPIKTLGK